MCQLKNETETDKLKKLQYIKRNTKKVHVALVTMYKAVKLP